MKHSERYKIGRKKLKEIDGDTGKKVIKSLKEISPDLGRYIIEYAFGDIYANNKLNLKSQEIAVVASLTAKGTATPQLKVHLNAALNVGCSINELKEVILQMCAYSGFPCSINAMNTLKDVLCERKTEGINDKVGNQPNIDTTNRSRYEIGTKELSMLDNTQVDKLNKEYNDFCPDLAKFAIEFGYGDLFSRDNLNKIDREIATIAALSAIGNAEPQLKFHINAGLNIGLTANDIKEILLLITIYAGFPACINGMNILKTVLMERRK